MRLHAIRKIPCAGVEASAPAISSQPACRGIKAADEFKDKTTAINKANPRDCKAATRTACQKRPRAPRTVEWNLSREDLKKMLCEADRPVQL